jgi:uncharacterized membrane protein
VRDWFHFDALIASPTDLARTTPMLFVTRWVTHLCAPTFVFLAGTSVSFVARRKTPGETTRFLLTRGLWLIVLQLTLVRFSWNFDPGFHFNSSNIISTIGFCMIVLALLIRLPAPTVMVVGLFTVAGHNALDGITFENGSAADVIWSFLHVHKAYSLGNGYSFEFLYPVVPWFAVMALGACLGRLYREDVSSERRRTLLLRMGAASLAVFAALRALNVYGDPVPWSRQRVPGLTLMSFFNLEKYPPTLLYLTATLGVALVGLGAVEGRRLPGARPVALLGRVALFYYVTHLFAIHALAAVAIVASGYPWQTAVLRGSRNHMSPLLAGHYGFGLATVYGVWLGLVLALYPACRAWDLMKTRNRTKWWVSYV